MKVGYRFHHHHFHGHRLFFHPHFLSRSLQNILLRKQIQRSRKCTHRRGTDRKTCNRMMILKFQFLMTLLYNCRSLYSYQATNSDDPFSEYTEKFFIENENELIILLFYILSSDDFYLA